MKRYASVFLLLFFSLVHSDDTQTMHALSSLFTSPSTSTTKWNTTNKNPCSWNGVNCTFHQVNNLSFSGFGLGLSNSTATLFFGLLCKLNSLQSLDLSSNSFTSIPTSFFSNCSKLSDLNSLNLSSNGLTGPLPKFSSFSGLEILDLSYNQLDGEIVSQFDALVELKSINLSFNLFKGTIPLYVGLKSLVLSNNNFTGNIPNGILHLKNLTMLDLSANLLSGPIPDGIGELNKLENLILSGNSLDGEIPSSLASIVTLQVFSANLNKFVGTIPVGITAHVRALDLSYNMLSGQIPSDFLSPPNLETVDLSYNSLSGGVPTNLSSELFRLRLSHISLNGTVPMTILHSSRMTYLELDDNELDGEIPSQLGKYQNLMLLNLAFNRLQGGLPKELGNMTKMVIMNLQENNLTGEIPKEFLKFGDLITLNLSHNSLSGAIPSEISNLQKLTRLNLQANKLNGSIPSTIKSLQNLMELQLGNNKLCGIIPRMPNSLSLALNLSSNFFAGSIPLYLGDLQQLEILDLSNNEFTGEVPSSLTNMQSLTTLVLSNNQLSGTLPVFHRWVSVTSYGNKNLDIPATNPIAKKNKSKVTIIIVCAAIGLGLVIGIFLLCVTKRFYRVEGVPLQLAESPPQIISSCLITSNSIHKSNIYFPKAMEVVGNPSNKTLKTRFSTYYRAEMPSGMSYNVKKLNWSEKIFQMGSHQRFGQELEVLGRLSNSNIMVPLAYVLTQDSAYLFYENVHKGTLFDFLHKSSENALDWQSRHSLALGVAQGLTFLHDCVEPILLLDLSTKSIHLKSMKEPQIGDIELCKVIDPSKSTGSLSTVAGSVGYIPPEYAYTMRVTRAGNVYSFGVILLELLTGKPPVSGGVELAKWASSFSARVDQRELILDSTVSRTSLAVRNQMLSVLKVALSCVSSSPEARPKIRNVYSMLFNAKY